jgi:hypothetical protein
MDPCICSDSTLLLSPCSVKRRSSISNARASEPYNILNCSGHFKSGHWWRRIFSNLHDAGMLVKVKDWPVHEVENGGKSFGLDQGIYYRLLPLPSSHDHCIMWPQRRNSKSIALTGNGFQHLASLIARAVIDPIALNVAWSSSLPNEQGVHIIYIYEVLWMIKQSWWWLKAAWGSCCQRSPCQ